MVKNNARGGQVSRKEEDQIPSGAGKTWLYVEPDGDVLPAQGLADQILGNVLTDPWSKIYSQ